MTCIVHHGELEGVAAIACTIGQTGEGDGGVRFPGTHWCVSKTRHTLRVAHATC